VLAALGVAGLLAVGATWACDTPVYLYTLLQWGRDPYRVYYLHRSAEPESDSATNRYLQNESAAASGHSNVTLAKANVDRLAADGSDRHAARLWAEHQSQRLPLHVVLTPRGDELFAGRLDLAAAKTLLDSPKRRELARQLSQGKHGLLLVLEGTNAAGNAAAAKVVRAAVAAAKAHELDVPTVTVSRSDPREAWLIKQLLSLEADLHEFTTPMVFGVFGRGHALEPFLGRGITEANITDLVGLMTGPCSCDMKAVDLGMDLLTDWDWDTHVAGLESDVGGPAQWTLFDMDESATDAAKPTAAPGAPLTKADQDDTSRHARAVPDTPAPVLSPTAKPAPPAPGTGEPAAGPVVSPPEPGDQPSDADARGPRALRDLSARVDVATHSGDEASFPLHSLLARRLVIGLGAALLAVAAVSAALLRRAREE
jgi:hypothetical protein